MRLFDAAYTEHDVGLPHHKNTPGVGIQLAEFSRQSLLPCFDLLRVWSATPCGNLQKSETLEGWIIGLRQQLYGYFRHCRPWKPNVTILRRAKHVCRNHWLGG
jgi:hypothetical protein